MVPHGPTPRLVFWQVQAIVEISKPEAMIKPGCFDDFDVSESFYTRIKATHKIHKDPHAIT